MRPNLLQRTINFDAYDLRSRDFYVNAPFVVPQPDGLRPVAHNLELSNARTNSLWGRKFKLRIRSKSSQKPVDINFSFNQRRTLLRKEEAPPSESQECDASAPDEYTARRDLGQPRSRPGGAFFTVQRKDSYKDKALQKGSSPFEKELGDIFGTKVRSSPKRPGRKEKDDNGEHYD